MVMWGSIYSLNARRVSQWRFSCQGYRLKQKKHASVIKPGDDSNWFHGSYHKAWTGNPSQSSISSGRPGGSTPTVSPNGSRWCPVGRRRGMDTPLCQLNLFLHFLKMERSSFEVSVNFALSWSSCSPCGLIWEAGRTFETRTSSIAGLHAGNA